MSTTYETIAVPSPPSWLLDVQEIRYEPEALQYRRTREIFDRFPGAARVPVASHWKIPALHGDPASVEAWTAIKREILILGVKSSISARPNCRSSDFIAPSHSNGCAMACSYCYVPRRKGYANPVTTFVNIERICGYLERHAARQGVKAEPSQTDPYLWVYDIGENGDCSVDALICDNVRDLVALFRRIPNAKATFATKYVNRGLLAWDPQRKTRIRFSLMPAEAARVVDVRTSPVRDRVAAINDFWEAGYEVHLNFSPVIWYDGWLEGYRALFDELAAALRPEVKQQLAAEVIFLTHNEQLHQINLGWHPRGEELLWRPDLQETKYSQTGGRNLRYKRGFKSGIVAEFLELLKQRLPECKVRYAF